MTLETMIAELEAVGLLAHWKFEEFRTSPGLETLPKFGLSQTQMDFTAMCAALVWGPDVLGQFRPSSRAVYSDLDAVVREVETYGDSVYGAALERLRPEIAAAVAAGNLTPLRRGRYVLPPQSQLVRRDLCLEEIESAVKAGHRGALGYMLTDAQVEERRRGGPLMPYRFLVYSPRSPALSWKAFMTADEFDAWLEAYGLHVEKQHQQVPWEREPGKQFFVVFPAIETLRAMS